MIGDLRIYNRTVKPEVGKAWVWERRWRLRLEGKYGETGEGPAVLVMAATTSSEKTCVRTNLVPPLKTLEKED